MIEAAYQRSRSWARGAGRYGPPKPIYFSSLLNRLGIAGSTARHRRANYNPSSRTATCRTRSPTRRPISAASPARTSELRRLPRLRQRRRPYVRYSGYQQALRSSACSARAAPSGRARSGAARARPAGRPAGALRLLAPPRGSRPGRGRAARQRRLPRANRVEAGIRSYDEVTALIISYYLKYPVESRAQ